MAEDSKKNFPSVRPKPINLQQSSDATEINEQPSSQNNTDIFEKMSLECQIPERMTSRSNSMDSQIQKDAEIRNESVSKNLDYIAKPPTMPLHFVNPYIKTIRSGFAPLMSCTLCYNLFNSERSPRIFSDGRTFCFLCILRENLNTPPDVVKQSYPLNISYVNAIRKFKNILEIIFSHHKTATEYSELERAIFTKKSDINLLKSFVEIINQRDMFLCSISGYHKKFITGNHIRRTLICHAMEATDNCKKYSLSKNFSKVLENFYKVSEIIESLEPTLNIYLEKESEENWLVWDLDASSDPDKKDNPQRIVSEALETYAFLEVDGVTRYSELKAHDCGLIIPSFVPQFPSFSKIGIAEFVLFGADTLRHINSVYFEIYFGDRKICKDVDATLVCKFNITLSVPTICLNVAYPFLGNERLSYKGAEIEVTNEFIIFDCFSQDGTIVPADLPKPPPWTICKRPVKIKEGMVLLMVRETTKLCVLKYTTVETDVMLYGELDPLAFEALRNLSLGRHRIFGCGIEVIFKDDHH